MSMITISCISLFSLTLSYMDIITLMITLPLSHIEILFGGTILFCMLGPLYFTPITPIGKKWVSYFPKPENENIPMSGAFVGVILLQIFMGFVVTHTVVAFWLFATASGLSETVATFFVLKLYMGFVFIKDIGHWFFEKKPFILILITLSYWLTGVLGVCGLLAYFL